ncbi:MAG: hypothetical protein ACRD1D_16330 [Acidimicrobiales bacterium]
MVRRLAVAAFAALGALALVGCGGDDDPSSAAQGAQEPASASLSVVAKDIDFSADSYRATAGSVPITYRNNGTLPHTLVIEGVSGFKLEVRAKGDVDRGSVDLAPGTYTVYCDIVGHRQAGMEATLTVA